MPDSRFEEAVELLAVCWFQVTAWVDCTELSSNTEYAAYLVFNLADESYGLDCPTQEASITMGDRIVSAKRVVSLYPPTRRTQGGDNDGGSDIGVDGRRADQDVERPAEEEEERAAVSYPSERDDGWMEVELGEFYNHQSNAGEMLSIRLIEAVTLNWKKGLVLEGMEIRQQI